MNPQYKTIEPYRDLLHDANGKRKRDAYGIPISITTPKIINTVIKRCIHNAEAHGYRIGKKQLQRLFKMEFELFARKHPSEINKNGQPKDDVVIHNIWSNIANQIFIGHIDFLKSIQREESESTQPVVPISTLKYKKYADRERPWTAKEIASRQGLKNYRNIYDWASKGLRADVRMLPNDLKQKLEIVGDRVFLKCTARTGRDVEFCGEDIDAFLEAINSKPSRYKNK